MNDIPVCYFCGKDQKQVKRLMENVGRFEQMEMEKRAICWDCVALHVEILASERVSFKNELIAVLQAIEPKYSD